jgi:hypothetical protein
MRNGGFLGKHARPAVPHLPLPPRASPPGERRVGGGAGGRVARTGLSVERAAVRNNGYALEFASEALQADPEVVLAAVGQNGRALIHASQALREDPFCVASHLRKSLNLSLRKCLFLIAGGVYSNLNVTHFFKKIES